MSVEYRWEWEMKPTPEQLWPYVSDTQRINKAVGLSPWQFTEEPDPLGGSKRTGRFAYLGMEIVWDENPYEWVAPREMGVVRTYRTGPVREVVSRVTLEPRGAGTHLTHVVTAEPRGVLGRLVVPIEVGHKTRKGFDRAYRQIEQWLLGTVNEPYPDAPTPPAPGAAARVEGVRKDLVAAGFAPPLVERLVGHVLTAPDRDLHRLRAFALADRWREDRVGVLRLCLHATRAGLLELSWDLVCPRCRGAKERKGRLFEIRPEVHCPSCNIRFDVRFDDSVELTFGPHPDVRSIEVAEYCVGGPGNTRHVLLQRRVPPGGRVVAALDLGRERYRVRGPRMLSGGFLTGRPDGAAGPVRIVCGAGGVRPAESEVAVGRVDLEFSNPEPFEQVVVVERTAWSDQIATAAYVSTMQEFRNLFTSEVLSPDMQAGVEHLAFLFTDMKASTAMYVQAGDPKAYALVRDHFRLLERHVAEEGGAVVKTIGDAVMAVYPGARAALRTAFRALRDFDRFNREHPIAAGNAVHLKIGVHAGPCIAVNLNDRLDYFGTTVNTAARVQGEATGGDLVVTEALYESDVAREVLAREPHEARRFSAALKGLGEGLRLVRIVPR